MALATRCPNCNALFRVAAEQLRSRGGMVRCGSCRRVFNAIAGLDYLDAERLAADDTPTRPPAPPPGPASRPVTQAPPAGVQEQSPGAPMTAAAPRPATLPPISAAASAARLPRSAAPGAGAPVTTGAAPEAPVPPTGSVPGSAPGSTPMSAPGRAPLAATAPAPLPSPAPGERRRNPRTDGGTGGPPPTLSESDGVLPVQFALTGTSGDAAPEGQGASFDTLFIVPKDEADGERGEDSDAVAQDGDAPPEAGFLQETPASPLVRGVLIAGCALLLPLLLAQLALIFRAPLVVSFPALRPALQALCTPLACSASWPMRPDLLAVVSSELQSVPGTDALELDAVLRSRAAYPLALPAIELTISDNSGHAVARKVFLPAEYLGSGAEGSTDAAGGNIAAGGDLAVRVYFALPGISAVNFEAYPFYP